jgi:hypothetical protein
VAYAREARRGRKSHCRGQHPSGLALFPSCEVKSEESRPELVWQSPSTIFILVLIRWLLALQPLYPCSRQEEGVKAKRKEQKKQIS